MLRQWVYLPLSLLLVFVTSSVSFAIPTQWTASSGGNDHWYDAILVPGGITWTEANNAAIAMGGGWHLATVTSAAENDIIFNLFSGNPAFYNCCLSGNGNGPWLGGFASSNTSNDWRWVTGEAFTYSNWGPLEPFGNGNRISYFGYHSSVVQPVWNDVPDSYGLPPLGYIIETSLSTSTVPEPSTLLLLGGGLAGLGLVRLRKIKKS